MGHKLTRREALVGTAATIIGFGALKAEATQVRKPKGDRPRVGIIGCGGKGWSGMEAAAQFADVVALCDVDMENRTKAMLEHPHAASYEDYREMIDAMKGKLDCVVISTPDHHHAPASAMAMKAGMHSYTEKPLCRTIWEARQLGRIAKDKHLATQMGNQSTASTAMRSTAALIAAGKFGHVKEVHLWTDRAAGWWPQGVDRPKTDPIPKKLNFDLWLGPRPDRPFANVYHPFSWRGWWDFGTGSLGDMGCHIFNMIHMAVNLKDPISVQAKTSGHNRESFPAWAQVSYEFGAKDGRPGFDLHWSDGGKRPDPSLAPGFEYGGNGVIVVCEHATVYSPNELNTEFYLVGGEPMPKAEVDVSPGHMAEFMRAVGGGPAAKSNFPGYSSTLTETVLLGNLAIWADGPKLQWDGKGMKVKGSTEFDGLIHPEFKPGWWF